ncbi:hypothetical protein SARC_10362, partial [Sphaeroforma arctica JP610]
SKAFYLKFEQILHDKVSKCTIIQIRDVYISEDEFSVWDDNKSTTAIAPPDTTNSSTFLKIVTGDFLNRRKDNTQPTVTQKSKNSEQLQIASSSTQQPAESEELCTRDSGMFVGGA